MSGQTTRALKSAVVTGASTGIGYATCKLLLVAGYRVFGSVRLEEDAVRLKADFGEHFEPLLMDVTDTEQIRTAVKKVRALLGGRKLGALVNNAGIAVVGPMLYMTVEQFRRQLDVNLTGVFEVTQAFLPLLGVDESLAGSPGKIINISSVAGQKGSPFSGAYAASKHGLEGMSECLRQELMLYGIDVVIVGPGVVDTPIWAKNLEQNLDRYEQTEYGPAIREMVDLTASFVKSGYQPEQVARVVVRALESKRPAVRYAVVPNKWLNWYLIGLIPKRWLDWLIAKRLRLSKK